MTCSSFRQQPCTWIECHGICAVQLPTLSRGGLVPKGDPIQFPALIAGDYSRQWGWEGEKAEGCIRVGQFLSVDLLFGSGECHQCHLLGSLCISTRGGNCSMGDCDIQGQRELLCYPDCPYPSQSFHEWDSPSWLPVKEVPRAGSAGLWRTSSEAEASAFIGECPAEWFSCFWGCAL